MNPHVLVGGKDRKVILAKRLAELTRKKENPEDESPLAWSLTTRATHIGDRLIEERAFITECSYLWSEKKLKERGYDGHLLPRHIHDLYERLHNGSADETDVIRDLGLGKPHQEWLGVALIEKRHPSRPGYVLKVYEHPTGIQEVINSQQQLERYRFDDIEGKPTHSFLLKEQLLIPLPRGGAWNHTLEQVHDRSPALFEYLYGKPYSAFDPEGEPNAFFMVKDTQGHGFLALSDGQLPQYWCGELHSASRGQKSINVGGTP